MIYAILFTYLEDIGSTSGRHIGEFMRVRMGSGSDIL